MTAVWIRLQHNWFRNLLAVVQVAIAIAALSAVFIDVLPAWTAASPEDGQAAFTVRFGVRTSTSAMWTGAFLPGDAQYLLERSDGIEAASVIDSRFQGVVAVGENRYMVRSFGYVHPSFQRLINLEMVAGAFFTAQDAAEDGPRVAVVSDELARLLYGGVDEALGETINVRPDMERSLVQGFAPPDHRAEVLGEPGVDVDVIGVFRSPSFGEWGVFDAEQTVMWMPAVEPGPGEPRRYASELLVKARPGMAQAAEDEIKALLRARLEERGEANQEMDGMPAEVLVEPMDEDGFRQVHMSNALVFGGLGLAALFVSAIAMFTTTLANLAQRTRYIGLGRALGATRGRVVREVMTETALLAGVGGLLGVAAAFPLRATLLSPLLGVFARRAVGFADVLWTGLAAVALAVAVGAVAGLYPAWTVARLAPAEAWREGQL